MFASIHLRAMYPWEYCNKFINVASSAFCYNLLLIVVFILSYKILLTSNSMNWDSQDTDFKNAVIVLFHRLTELQNILFIMHVLEAVYPKGTNWCFFLSQFLVLGKLKPTLAFMSGKLKIKGNMALAIKLEKLMSQMQAKLWRKRK